MKELVIKTTEMLKNEFISLSEYIYINPELGYEEFKSSKAHVDLLKRHGFKVYEKYLGLETAFRAEYIVDREGPVIAYFSEYDALPGIGHGCGHNILGATSTGAGIVLSKFAKKIGGNVIVFGTPAEETSGAKVEMAEKGAFKDIDVAMLAHPESKYIQSGNTLAIYPIEFIFKGKTAHAATLPDKGVNALDGVILTFNAINALREHILPSSRIHGIIKEGGEAANIVPELAVAQFYIRSTSKKYLKEILEKVINCAKGASLATGTKLEINTFETPYDNLVTNKKLSSIYKKHLVDFKIRDIYEPELFYGSLDMGNVSQFCPTIHPFFNICEVGQELALHTKEFGKATLTDTAYKNMAKTICALVLTGIDVIKDKELLQDIKKEFKEMKE